MTVEEKYNILVKELNIKEYHDNGYKGKGVVVASVEDTDGDHGNNVKNTVLTYAPEVTFLTYNHPIYSATSDDGNGHIEFPNFVDWCIKNKVDIVTSSLSWSCNNEEERQAIRKLYDNGIVYVNCAGNENNTLEHRPNGNQVYTFDKESICVGAVQYNTTKNKFQKASFSNYGEAIDVMMEGNATPMKSFLDPTDEDYEEKVERYGRNYLWVGFNGTSAATPMLAGLLACYKSYDKNLNSKNAFDLINASYIPLEYDGIEYKIFRLPKLNEFRLKGELIMEEQNNNSVAEWAKEAQRLMIELGISDGTEPTRNITRQEIWTMLERFYKVIKK